MSVSALTRRYAKALVDLALEQKAVAEYGDELARVQAVFAEEKLFRQFLDSPTLALNKKEAMLAEVAVALKLSSDVSKFLGLLLSKDRLRYLAQIEEKYRALADEMSGIVRARLVSAKALSDAQQQAIGTILEQQTGKQVALTVNVDPALIGGVQTEIGGRLFDGSVKTQLRRIEESLTKG